MTSEERCAVFQTAAAFSETGAIVYSWDSDEPWPECEYIDGFAAERAGIEAEAFMRDPSRFFSSDPLNTAFIHAARDRALAEDPSRYEVPWAAASGQIYWLECSVQQLGRKPDGRLRFAVISRDVDERRHMAEERALLADAVEQAPDGVLIFRVDREHPLWPPIVYANAGFCAMTGYTKDEIASGTYPQIFDERSDVDSIKDCAQRVFAGEQVAYELILLRKDKTSFWAEARAHLLESPPEYGVLLINDITERRAQHERMSLLNEAVENASEYVIITGAGMDGAGTSAIIYANRAFCESVGISPEEALGKRFNEFSSSTNDPKLLLTTQNNIDAGRDNFREILIRRKDGSEYWIEYAAKAFQSQEGGAFRIAVGRDVTYRRRAQNQVSLLISALDRSANRITLYESDQENDPVVAYENEAASKSEVHRLLDIWKGGTERSRHARSKLLAGQYLTDVYTEKEAGGIERMVEFSAHAISNGNRVEAVFTSERVLAESRSSAGYRSVMMHIARLLPTIAEASSSSERFDLMRALLWDAFKAKIKLDGPSEGATVRIDSAKRCAVFSLDANRYTISWPRPLEESAVTALRFCIEAVVEGPHESAHVSTF